MFHYSLFTLNVYKLFSENSFHPLVFCVAGEYWPLGLMPLRQQLQ